MEDNRFENGFTVNTENIPQETAETLPQGTENAAESNAPVSEKLAGSKKQKGGKKAKKGSSGTLKSLVTVLVIIVISLAAAFVIIFTGADYLGIGFGRGKDCVMEIPSGASTAVIAEKLSDTGAVKMPLLFRIYSKLKHYDSKYKYGVYTFNSELGYESIAQMLMTEGAVAESKTVTIKEMSSIDDMAETLEENGICEKSDFIDAVQNGEFNYDFIKDIPEKSVYYRLEGYLFPDTYNFYACEDSKEGAYLAVDTMLRTLEEKTAEIRKNLYKNYTFHQIMTMASIVELEAGGSPDQMAGVAAVFYNRLESDEFSTLGSSPTRKYPHGDGRYDTYTCEGLPPGPLCAPSIKAIKAANAPDQNNHYYYFVTDKSMNFYYRKTLKEHNQIIAKLQAENNWIYED